MKTIALTVMTLISVASFAQSKKVVPRIACVFTEPFINVDMLIKEDGSAGKVIISSVSADMKQKGSITSMVESEDGKSSTATIKTKSDEYKLTIFSQVKGSDGMSDLVYMAEGRLVNTSDKKEIVGGCNLIVE
jgi:hypothetical protein